MSWTVKVLICGFLHLCSGHSLSCNVTRNGNQTTYMVPPVKDMNLTGFSWANQDRVFATNMDKVDPVESSTADILISSQCIADIVLNKEYSKDGTLLDFTANCSTNCEAVNVNQVQDEPFNLAWIALLVGGLLIALCFIFKDKIFRTCCCRQTGGYFTSVKVIQEAPREVTVISMPD